MDPHRSFAAALGAALLALSGLSLAGCGDASSECDRGDCSDATAASGLATSGGPGITATGGTMTSGATAGTDATDDTAGTDDSTSGSSTGVKFDLGDQPESDLPEEKGPIIPETCEQALAGESTVGCRFYAVDMDSHDGVENQQYAVAVANVQLGATANVVIEIKSGGVWSPIAGPQAIGPLDLFTFNLPSKSTDDSQLAVGGAYRVSSDVPVIAYQFNPVDGATSYLSDASMLFPATALDTINDVIAWSSMMDNSNTFQHSYATVIATVDGTTVKVTPTVPTATGGGVPPGAPGVPFMVSMNEGDVLSVANLNLGDSMTGTKIVSNDDHPIAVFSGQECALIPETTCCCDHMEEQLAGLRQWGTHFVASRMPVRNPGQVETSLWQIYASEDATQVTLNYDPGVTGIPNNNVVLNQGQMLEIYVGGTPAEPGDFEVVASKPINVVNYMIGSENMPAPYNATGDPAMVQLSPVEQFLPRYVVLVPGTWINDIAVITRPAGAPITIDNAPISDAEFNPVAGSGFEVARIAIPDGVHVLDGGAAAFGVVIVGYDQWDSYAYLGGAGTGVINPDPPG
ncbi:MAG: IgGFc-binding protein [Nannocystaceae bacterium]|nr:IgGFc-binding protein [Myxococcales bacterium]